MKSKEISHKIYHAVTYAKENKAGFILFILTVVICWVSFIYWDTQSITAHSISAWDLLIKGNFNNFYSNSIELTVDGISTPANYNMTLYIFFIIWNFPLWILKKIYGFDPVESSICMVYSKGILVLFLFISIILVFRIARQLGINQKLAMASTYLYATSLIVLSSVLVIGQSDIIVVTFTLMAFSKYLNEDKFYILWFAIAISMKFYAAFIFIPILLLKEKKIWKIIFKTLLAFSLSFICRIPFLNDKIGMNEVNRFSGEMLEKLFINKLPVGDGSIPVIILFLVLVFVYCWLKQFQSGDDWKRLSLYVIFLTYAGVFILFDAYPYWLMHIMPYLPIILMLNTNKIKENLILECLSYVMLTFSWMFRNLYSVCYDLTNIDKSALSRIFGRVPDLKHQIYYTNDMVERNNNLITQFNLEKYSPWFFSVFTGCVIILLVYNRPKTWQETDNKTDISVKMLLARQIINGIVCCLPLIFYFISVFISSI